MTKPKNFVVATVLIIALILIIGIAGIRDISTMRRSNPCGGNGIYITDSSGKSTFVSTNTYVSRPVYASESLETDGDEYTKEGLTTLLNIDCDVKEAFELLDDVQMRVKMTIGNTEKYQAYVRGSDGFIYLVRTDSEGTILRDENGVAEIVKRCDFADLYLGSN